MTLPNYEIYAIKYATRDAKRAAHFVGGDPHDGECVVARAAFHGGDPTTMRTDAR